VLAAFFASPLVRTSAKPSNASRGADRVILSNVRRERSSPAPCALPARARKFGNPGRLETTAAIRTRRSVFSDPRRNERLIRLPFLTSRWRAIERLTIAGAVSPSPRSSFRCWNEPASPSSNWIIDGLIVSPSDGSTPNGMIHRCFIPTRSEATTSYAIPSADRPRRWTAVATSATPSMRRRWLSISSSFGSWSEMRRSEPTLRSMNESDVRLKSATRLERKRTNETERANIIDVVTFRRR
jgi:hypothetical protein